MNLKTIKRLRKLLFLKLIQLLPDQMRFHIIRKSTKIAQAPEGQFKIEIATSKSDLEKAYSILYDAYLEYGFQTANESKMRIIKYFMLPTTTTIIAKLNDEVIGTISIIRKTSLGLPLESEFDYSQNLAPGETVAEVSSLAISKKFRHLNGSVFLPMCSYVYNYLRFYVKIDKMVIAVNPAWSDFYQALLLFEKLKGRTVGTYNFANGAPAVGLISDVSTLEKRLFEIYGKKDNSANIFKVFHERDESLYKWPLREVDSLMDPVWNIELFQYFFVTKSNVLKNLSHSEKEIIRTQYIKSPIFSKFFDFESKNNRKSIRFDSKMIGVIDKTIAVEIVEVSSDGLRIAGAKLNLNQVYWIQVYAGQQEPIEIQAKVIWANNSDQSFGLLITSTQPRWTELFEQLEKQLIRIAS